MRRISRVLLVPAGWCSAAARVQETVRPLPIKSRAIIFVVDEVGVEHRGRFIRADDQDLVMLVNGDERRLNATPRGSTVREIR